MIRDAPVLGAANRWAIAISLVAGLLVIVGARVVATRAGVDPLMTGAAFGLLLGGLWYAGTDARWSRVIARPVPGARQWGRLGAALGAGLAVGLALIGLAVVGGWFGAIQLPPGMARAAAPFPAWALVTILVATTEEGILRGALFDAVRAPAGPAMALLLTTVVFALIHVPLYGWGVVPLDLAVGLALGGLRLATGTLVAPAVAHVVADLATWWL